MFERSSVQGKETGYVKVFVYRTLYKNRHGQGTYFNLIVFICTNIRLFLFA